MDRMTDVLKDEFEKLRNRGKTDKPIVVEKKNLNDMVKSENAKTSQKTEEKPIERPTEPVIKIEESIDSTQNGEIDDPILNSLKKRAAKDLNKIQPEEEKRIKAPKVTKHDHQDMKKYCPIHND